MPVVPEDKHEKLANVLKKIYSQIGNVREGEHVGIAAVNSLVPLKRSTAAAAAAVCAGVAQTLPLSEGAAVGTLV